MNKMIFREIRTDADVTDTVAKLLAFISIPAALFLIAFSLWTIFTAQGNACGPGIC